MKVTTKLFGTICFAIVILVSGVLAQEAVTPPLKQDGSSSSKSDTLTKTRVSVVDYIKAVETINAYNAIHRNHTSIPGITNVPFQLEPQPSYQDLFAAQLRRWDSFRTEQFVIKHEVRKFATQLQEYRYTPERDWASSLLSESWQRQEFVREFNRDRLVMWQGWPRTSSVPSIGQITGR